MICMYRLENGEVISKIFTPEEVKKLGKEWSDNPQTLKKPTPKPKK